jgi:F-type H+-transporting ATPase subunit b
MDALGKLGINPWLLIAQIVNFAILLVVLYIFLYKPILKLFKDRSTKIDEGLKNAEKLKTDAAESEQRQKAALEEARREAHRIVEQATKLGDEEKKKIMELAGEESRKIVERTLIELSAEKKNIMNDIKKEVGEMVVNLSLDMVKKQLDEKTQKELLNQAIQEVEQKIEEKP